MAELDSSNKSQDLVSEIASATPQKQANPSKFCSGFLYKALIVTLFLAILPLFPSQAPEFINQTVFNRSWELLHLVFVGIAVSYGLFSRRNDEAEKENHSKFDNAQSYVSRFLQVSSVFDEEVETPSGLGESKLQTWSNQYYRGKPDVVVTQESSVLHEQSSKGSSIGEKPLFLPVRSLKSRVSDPGDGESGNGDGGISRSLSWSGSNSVSKRFSNNRSKTKKGELGGLDHPELEKTMEQNVVLPSPIPWKSRSGRMEMKEQVESLPQYSFPSPMEDAKINKTESRSFRSQSSGSSHSSPASSSPKNLSPSASFSSPKKPPPSESQAKSVEDFARKKIFYKPPPPPPPPPPPIIPSAVGARGSMEKALNRSMANESKYLSRSGREEILRRANSGVETIPRTQVDGSVMGKSVRMLRAGESVAGMRRTAEVGDDEKKPKEAAGNITEKTGRKMVAFDQLSARAEKPTLIEYERGGKKEISENIVLDSEEESSSDEEGYEEGSEHDEAAAATSVGDGGHDVNKKADEFIAKFREQIRLQRIESIKQSSAQLRKNISRQN